MSAWPFDVVSLAIFRISGLPSNILNQAASLALVALGGPSSDRRRRNPGWVLHHILFSFGCIPLHGGRCRRETTSNTEPHRALLSERGDQVSHLFHLLEEQTLVCIVL